MIMTHGRVRIISHLVVVVTDEVLESAFENKRRSES